jgi:uncharacterized protein (DUF58 family)
VTFPLIPRGRLAGLSFGTMRSFHRGRGSDVIGSRPYQVGDDVHAIDWAASARWSSARGSDEFIVRERYADEAPRVVILCDRRPEMSFFSSPLPWLDKPQALRRAADLVLRSALLAGGFVGYLDHAEGHAYWVPPRGVRRFREVMERRLASAPFAAPADSVELALAHLLEHHRSVSSGTFVFVLSDFIPAPADEAWFQALERRWDVVPVVIQDPVWEQSFPDVGGIAVPLRNPRTGRISPALLTARETLQRRAANEERFAGLLEGFRGLDVDPIVLSSSDPVEILTAFLDWSDARRTRRVARR